MIPPITRLIATEASTAAAIATNRRRRSEVKPPSRWPPLAIQARRKGESSGCRDRLVARAANRADQVRAAELAPQLGHVHVDGARSPGEGPAPNSVEQLLA